MNPYLEQGGVWQDFRSSYVPLMRDALVGQVRPAYTVHVEEYLFIQELPDGGRRPAAKADLSVARAPGAAAVRPSGTALAAPARGRLPVAVDIERHAYLEIRDRYDRAVVTVLELLSPSNKRTGPDREQYLAKRLQITSGLVHFVEIDLLRSHPRLPVEDLPACDYYVLVSRAEERPDVALWPLRLRDHLPTIPVPLRATDSDAGLDLQELLHSLYDPAGYGDYIYKGTPRPRLSAEDEAWARQFVPAPPANGA
jgi:hypothetical protein